MMDTYGTQHPDFSSMGATVNQEPLTPPGVFLVSLLLDNQILLFQELTKVSRPRHGSEKGNISAPSLMTGMGSAQPSDPTKISGAGWLDFIMLREHRVRR